MGKFYDLIQEHIDAQRYPVSERQVAKQLNVSQTTLANWRTPKRLIDKRHLEAVATLTGNPFRRVVDALIEDIGYDKPGPIGGEGDAE